MNNDTQKIRADLRAQVQQAEQQERTLENAALIRWLKSKLDFYESNWHQVYKEQNNAEAHPPVQFERQPDEDLL